MSLVQFVLKTVKTNLGVSIVSILILSLKLTCGLIFFFTVTLVSLAS